MKEAACSPVVLRTRRLILRQWQDDDRAPFAALNADPDVMKHFPSPLGRADSDALAQRFRAAIDERGWGLWAAEADPIAAFIGFIGLAVAGPGLPCSGAVEIGWRLSAAHWGQGYATEGAREALRFAFDDLGLHEVVSFTAAVNTKSSAVMERLGMRRDARTFEHPRCPEGSAIRTHVLYRLQREAWLAAGSDDPAATIR